GSWPVDETKAAPASRPSVLTERPSLPTLHHMAKFQGSQLDRTFAALVDPTRRAILARLEQEDSVSIGELARPFAIKLPAVMKHLDVLGAAGLITRSKTGRTVAVRLAPEPMAEAMDWLGRYERFWSATSTGSPPTLRHRRRKPKRPRPR